MANKIKALALAVAAALPVMVQAQEVTTLSDVVVKASALKALPAENLTAKKPTTADSAGLVSDLPGVALQGAGAVSSLPVVHGLADDRVKVQVDGMELISACANHMNPPLSYIDPAQVGSVKLVAGISPVSLGGDSLAGVIKVDSLPPLFAQAGQSTLFKGELGAFLRSNGNAKGGHLAATVASESVSVNFKAAGSEAGNYKAGGNFKPAGVSASTVGNIWLAGDEVGSSAYKTENESLNLAWRHGDHLFEASFGRQHLPYQGFPNQRMDMTGNDSHQLNLHYTGRFDWGKLEARVYREKTRHKMNFLEDKLQTTNLIGMPMDTEGENTGALVKADIALSQRDRLRVGAELQRYRLNDWWDPISSVVSGSMQGMKGGTFWNIRDGERDRIDVYSEWEARWDNRWLTNVGVRSGTVHMNTGQVQGYNTTIYPVANYAAFNAADRSRTDNNIDLTALARFTPSAEATYEFGFARKSRSPNLYERYSWSSQNTMVMNMINWTGDANGYVGNLNLKPEAASTLSASADWHDAAQEKWQVKFSPYYTRVQDYIDAQRCPVVAGTACTAANLTAATGFVYLQFVNQSAELKGADLSGYLRLGALAGAGEFTLSGLVNYVQGKNKTTGDNLYNIMPLNGRVSLSHSLGAWGNTLEVVAVDAKTHVSAVRNELKTGGYGLLNLRTAYDIKQFRLDFAIENLLNKNYALPLGGAYVGQRTMIYGTPVAGPGRSVNVGLTVRF